MKELLKELIAGTIALIIIVAFVIGAIALLLGAGYILFEIAAALIK